MAENKPEVKTFREISIPSDSSKENSADENDDAVSKNSSSDEGEYELDSNTEEKSDPLEETNRKLSLSPENDNNTISETMPSAITDKEYIYMPQSFENFEEREEWNSSGKWLLYVQGDLKKLDYLWLNLRPLLADDTLICLKSSTGCDRIRGVIMCYTSDCEDRRAVKKAADAIRSIVTDDEMLYYKTNEASDSGLYKAHGDNFITKYMHSVAGSLYERDEYNRWKKVFLDDGRI